MDILQTREKYKIPCVILAGGKSSRMGTNKALLPFGTFDSLVQYQYEKASKIFDQVFISSKSKLGVLDESTIVDSNKLYSPLIALNTILRALNYEYIFILPVDYPLITIQIIHQIMTNYNKYDIQIASTKYLHYLLGVFSKNCFQKIEEMISKNNHKIKDLINSCEHNTIYFDCDNSFINMNYLNEYEMIKNRHLP